MPAVAQPAVRADQASELARLREQLARLIARQSQSQPVLAPTPKRRVEPKRSRVSTRAQSRPDNDPLRSIDSNDGDPIKGM